MTIKSLRKSIMVLPAFAILTSSTLVPVAVYAEDAPSDTSTAASQNKKVREQRNDEKRAKKCAELQKSLEKKHEKSLNGAQQQLAKTDAALAKAEASADTSKVTNFAELDAAAQTAGAQARLSVRQLAAETVTVNCDKDAASNTAPNRSAVAQTEKALKNYRQAVQKLLAAEGKVKHEAKPKA